MNEAISSSNTAAPYSEYWVNSASYPRWAAPYSEYWANSASYPQRDGGRHRTPSTGPTQPPIPSGTAGGAVLRVLGQLGLLSPAGRRAAPYSEYWTNSASYPQRDGGRCRTPFTASTQPPIPGGRHRTPSTGPTRPPIPSGTAGGAVLRVLGQLSLLSPAGRRAVPYSEYWSTRRATRSRRSRRAVFITTSASLSHRASSFV